MNRYDIARLAAFIDGEGHINLRKVNHPKCRNGCWGLRLSVCNTDPRLPAWCQALRVGGYFRTSKKATAKSKTLYLWEISGPGAAKVLRMCMPFFVIKKEEASLALEFYSTFAIRTGRAITAEVAEKREELRNKLFVMRKPWTAKQQDAVGAA